MLFIFLFQLILVVEYNVNVFFHEKDLYPTQSNLLEKAIAIRDAWLCISSFLFIHTILQI